MTEAAISRTHKIITVLQYLIIAITVYIIAHTTIADRPYATPSPPAAASDRPRVQPPDHSPGKLDDYAILWGRNLRQILVEPEPTEQPNKKPPKPKPPKPVLLPTLLATFVEGDTGWALFESKEGKRQVRSEQARIDDFQIVKISPGTASLKRNERIHHVKVPRKTQSARHVGRRG